MRMDREKIKSILEQLGQLVDSRADGGVRKARWGLETGADGE